MRIRVGIVGYGTIGKRVADAVMLQDDMELSGITANSFNYRIELAARQGIPVFAAGDPAEFQGNGIRLAGGMDDLIASSDIIVDCTPGKIGKENKERYYLPGKIKAIFQGGEKSGVAQASFCAQCNYGGSFGKDYLRVVSCNTTGLARSLGALDRAFGIRKVRATLIRRAADPHASDKGPINAIVPSFDVPSHHGPDVNTVLPGLNIMTTAVIVPTTLMHLHCLNVELSAHCSEDEVRDVMRRTTRVRLVRSEDDISSTAGLMEMARDIGSRRGDINEVCIWEDGIRKSDGELFFSQAIHQESIVIPENIDAIRAAMGVCGAEESIARTNKSLNIK